MTDQEYRRAMDCFESDIYMKRRIAAAVENGRRDGRPVRRALAGVLTAAAVLVCAMGVAMAASPGLRQTVLSFFHMAEAEQVPGPGEVDMPDVLESDVGGQVKAQYIQWNGAYSGRMTVEENEDGYVFHVWDVEDGVLSKQTVEAQKSTFTVTWRDADYQGTVYWGVQNGELFLSADDGYDRDTGTEWHLRPIAGRTDTALLEVSQGSQIEYASYELLYHLDTGEVEDILTGTGVENLELAYDYTWADDLSRLLVTCQHGDQIGSAQTYYCDIADNSLMEIGDLTGLEADSAFFADGETLIISSLTDTKCSCWAYDLVTETAVQVLDQANLWRSYDENPYGIMFFGARYGVYAELSGQISVFDFKTGERMAVDAFTLSKGGRFLSNSSNTKLLYWAADDSVSGLGISELGVLDLEKGVFLSFDREGYDALYEWSVGWFDDDRAEIHAYSQDGETQYLYLYEF